MLSEGLGGLGCAMLKLQRECFSVVCASSCGILSLAPQGGLCSASVVKDGRKQPSIRSSILDRHAAGSPLRGQQVGWPQFARLKEHLRASQPQVTGNLAACDDRPLASESDNQFGHEIHRAVATQLD